jgi:DNA-binding NtrC family response regulator
LLTNKNYLDAPQIERALLPISNEEARAQGPWSGLILPLDEWEKEAIRRALAQVRGNKAKASRMLGIHRNTLLRKLAVWKL